LAKRYFYLLPFPNIPLPIAALLTPAAFVIINPIALSMHQIVFAYVSITQSRDHEGIHHEKIIAAPSLARATNFCKYLTANILPHLKQLFDILRPVLLFSIYKLQ
jgi:hypothetical protein